MSYNASAKVCVLRSSILILFLLFLSSCAPAPAPSAQVQILDSSLATGKQSSGFARADGSRPLYFPEDFGAHEDFRSEWWYYTGNLQTPQARHFGFELTIFRVSLLPPAVSLPEDSQWYDRSVYFSHFAVSDLSQGRFHAFERYARPGPGLAGAQADPYRIWIEDWSIAETGPAVYHLQARQFPVAVDLTLRDEMGVVLHGENGYSRKGQEITNASYYYSQPRLQADGVLEIEGVTYPVSGLVWKDHEFSTSALEENQIGWDWFSLQFEDGRALMLFQIRERDGRISPSSSGTFIQADGRPRPLPGDEFTIAVLDTWYSPHTGGNYPAGWEVRIDDPKCRLQIHPWMADQEIHFTAVTYWEGAVHFEGVCQGRAASGNGYVELTGYTGNLPLP